MKIVTILKLGGIYKEKHVCWLQRQIKEPIICITDSLKPMENVTSIPLKYDWPGWWSKMEMFRPDLAFDKFLYTDLDQVFLDGVPQKYKDLKQTTVLKDICREPKPTMNSGLMFINGTDSVPIWKDFMQDPIQAMKTFLKQGDQGFIDLHLNRAQRWQTLFPGEIVSYKTEVQFYNHPKLRGKEKIIVFHGQPKPWDIQLYWIPKL